jgi:hypothetical protein
MRSVGGECEIVFVNTTMLLYHTTTGGMMRV